MSVRFEESKGYHQDMARRLKASARAVQHTSPDVYASLMQMARDHERKAGAPERNPRKRAPAKRPKDLALAKLEDALQTIYEKGASTGEKEMVDSLHSLGFQSYWALEESAGDVDTVEEGARLEDFEQDVANHTKNYRATAGEARRALSKADPLGPAFFKSLYDLAYYEGKADGWENY